VAHRTRREDDGAFDPMTPRPCSTTSMPTPAMPATSPRTTPRSSRSLAGYVTGGEGLGPRVGAAVGATGKAPWTGPSDPSSAPATGGPWRTTEPRGRSGPGTPNARRRTASGGRQ
jgi:hypothetical protein